jgi:hypothetical protein
VRRGAVSATVVALAVVACAGAPVAEAAPRGCDPLDRAACLLPWPNDYFVKHGRLALRDAQMPRNADGVPIRAQDYNRSDGFSPGQTIVTRVPRLDLERSGAVPLTDLARSYAKRAPIVVIDARSGKRQLIWAELDAQATSAGGRALLIHPGANWREGHRYVVALRNLRDRRGRLLGAGRAFRVYRDRLASRSRAVKQRRPHMERIFRSLRRAGIARRSLYLAWDFTIASRANLSQRLLSIRDRAFAELGDTDLADRQVQGGSPAFTVDGSADVGGGVRRVDGHFTVPCFLDAPGCPPGSRFELDRKGLPVRTPGNSQQANFICLVPASASAATPARPLLFGHGLFGTADAVLALAPLAALGNFVACATDWSGMSTSDLPNVLALSRELSRFPTLPDRNQQGLLDFMFLGRLMLHPQGLVTNPAIGSVIDQRRLFFAGASQGGILGGALTAVAPDFDRAALIVPGMNFSLLLPRSSQFERFKAILYPAYPRQIDRPLLTSLIQLLWDRGEANGYAWHVTRDPYPNTPPHTVLLHEAFGDHQVSNAATEVEARVLGARLRTPALDAGRSLDRTPFYGIESVPSYPWDGNALALYDIGPLRMVGGTVFGTPPAPPVDTIQTKGVDPHALTAFELPAAQQLSEFLELDGAFVDTCSGQPCHAAGWTGP